MSLYEDVLVKTILAEIAAVRDSGAISATAIMTYVAIDTMAYLSMPLTKSKNSSIDFIDWVNKYMKTDSSQSYQYNGKDMWGSRCAKLHSYASDSEYAKKNHCKAYGYHDGSDHLYVPKESKKLVLISVRRLVNDFCDALAAFIQDISKDNDLKKRTDQRLPMICNKFNVK